jgi:hypothetical protein
MGLDATRPLRVPKEKFEKALTLKTGRAAKIIEKINSELTK